MSCAVVSSAVRLVISVSCTVLSSGVLLDLLFHHQTLASLPVLDQARHIAPHLLNLADQPPEVLLDRVQEIGERCLNLLHFLLDADDTLLELLADIGRA